jgi:hypothetical protein
VWIWPPPSTLEEGSDIDDNDGGGGSSLGERLLMVCMWPVGVMYVIVLDIAAILSKFGFYPKVGDNVYSLEHYHESRSTWELVVESIPQACLQSIVYILGSSMATRIFVDDQVFFRSIVSSVLNVLYRYSSFMWTVRGEKSGFLALLWSRLKSRSGPSLIKPTIVEELVDHVDQVK